MQSARSWIPTYRGKNIVRGYRNWYGVDVICAIRELRMLGVQVSNDCERKVRDTMDGRAKKNPRGRLEKTYDGLVYGRDYDDNFAYIAGHTPAGVPFGVTWETHGEPDSEER